ncbi:hypothetical protein D3C81_683740 [compost metagenome]
MTIEQSRIGMAVVPDDKGIDILGGRENLQNFRPSQRNSGGCSGSSSLHVCCGLAKLRSLHHHANQIQRSCVGEKLLRGANGHVLQLRVSLGLSISQCFEYQAAQTRALGLLLHTHRHACRALAAIGKGDEFATTAR